MKTIISLCLCAMMTTNAMAQTANDNDNNTTVTNNTPAICEKPDTPEQYEGGERAIHKYIKANMNYPFQAQREAVEGTVIVSYILNEEGLTDEVEAVSYNDITGTKTKSITAYALDKLMEKYPKLKAKAQKQYMEAVQSLLVEAVRLVFNMPEATTPAMKDGKPVKVKRTIPIEFEFKEKHI